MFARVQSAVNRRLTISRFSFCTSAPRMKVTLMAEPASRERSDIFMRCNFELPERAPGMADPVSSRPERSFEVATGELLGQVEQGIARIKRQEGAEAALRELATILSRIEAIVARDPGIKMAADDLYDAAAALVAGQRAEPAAVDIRIQRLMHEADSRLRARLAMAQPSQNAKLLGLN